jgi:hypothetical protein
MLRKSNPTSNPPRFNSKSFLSLLESVTSATQNQDEEKPNKTSRRGGGAKKSDSESMQGYGAKKPEKESDESHLMYTSGIPLAFYRTGLGMQQLDYRFSKYPFGEMLGAAFVGSALPTVLGAFDGKDKKGESAAKAARDATPEIDVDVPEETEREMEIEFGFQPNRRTSSNTRKAKTITVAGKEMSVRPDSFMGKYNVGSPDPYNVGPFIDYVNRMNYA